MNAFKNFIALDLELNNANNNLTPNPKIIQIGVAWGSWDHYAAESINTKKWYIDPNELIYPEITELTGITNEDIKNYAVSHETAARELSKIILDNDTFINPITWGGGDSIELLSEFREKNIHFPHFGRRWVDVKTWHVYHMLSQDRSVSGGLKGSMTRYGLKFQGIPHRADVDALNTLRLFFKMLDNQDKVNTLINIAKKI